MNEKKWLEHISNEITIGSRNRLSAYLIALEGWRRGLELTWYSKKVKEGRSHAPGRLFSLESSEGKHFFYKSRGDLTNRKAQSITGNKYLTKQWLSEAGVSVPKGEMFTEEDSDESILEYANRINYPVVLKPTNGYQGIGVFANLKNEIEFSAALNELRNEMQYKRVIVEEYVDGIEYRVFVLGDSVVGAVEKIPPNIIGDGKSTVQQLINKKNLAKRNNPHLFKKPIIVDFEVKSCLEDEKCTVESILEAGRTVYLRKKNSLSSGGDPIDATDKISKETKQTSIDALNAIPNLAQGGLDVIVDNKTGVAKIIEINAIPMIGSHIFPEFGQARDVPSAIIDYYFPETKQLPRYKHNIYFDLQSVLTPLINRTASKTIVTPAPLWNEMVVKRYRVEGKVQKVGYRKWIRRKALENDLYGYVQNQKDGSVQIVVAGEQQKVTEFHDICIQGPVNANVININKEIIEVPIKVGFEIKPNPKRRKKKKKVNDKSSQVKQEPTTLFTKIKRKLKKR